MKSKVKIDWDTVELVGSLTPVTSHAFQQLPPEPSPSSTQRSFPDRRGRSIPKQILSGAAAKARARGATHTHAQLRKLLPAGLETFIYGWWLVAAAVESDRDLSRGVELAAHAIEVISHRVSAHAHRVSTGQR